jgi:heme-degrading monooxygenase HmoA
MLKGRTMLVERSEMLIKDGLEDEFAAMMKDQGLPLLAALEGAKHISFGRGLEQPEKFMLLLEWETMEAHIAFTKHPSFPVFRALVGPYTTGGAMEHFNMD